MIRVSVEGQDATQVPDWQALFSANYPLLKIAYQGNFTADRTNTSPQVMVQHNLGYPPMFLVNVNWGDYTGDPGFTGLSALATYGANTYFRVDSSNLWFEIPFPDTGTVRCRYYVFHQDLTEQYDFSNLATATRPYGNLTEYGLKVTPPGFDAEVETDFRNFSLHTATRSLPIHMVRNYQSTGVPYVFAHGLPYPPFTIHWQKYDTNDYWSMYGNSDYDAFLVTTDATNVTHDPGGISGVQYTIMVMKDPFNLA